VPLACRLCFRSDPHVHETDTRVRGAELPPAHFKLNIQRITRIDFALPAIKQGGKWWLVSHDVLDLVWPMLKQRAESRPRPSPEDQQEPDEEPDEDD
jgi:hypothetical protein